MKLLAAHAALVESLGLEHVMADRVYARLADRVREAEASLEPEVASALRAAGRALSPEQALAELE